MTTRSLRRRRHRPDRPGASLTPDAAWSAGQPSVTVTGPTNQWLPRFVYRGSDVMGAWTEGLLGRLGFALVGFAALAVPLALVWAGLESRHGAGTGIHIVLNP